VTSTLFRFPGFAGFAVGAFCFEDLLLLSAAEFFKTDYPSAGTAGQ